MTKELAEATDDLLNSWEHTSGATRLPDGYTIDDLHADVAAAVEQTAKRCAEIARAVAVDHEAVFAELERYSVGSDFRSTSQTAHGIADRIRGEFGITEGV